MCVYIGPIYQVSGTTLASFVIEMHFLKRRRKRKKKKKNIKKKEKEISEFGWKIWQRRGMAVRMLWKKKKGEIPDTSRHKFGDIFQAKW